MIINLTAGHPGQPGGLRGQGHIMMMFIISSSRSNSIISCSSSS